MKLCLVGGFLGSGKTTAIVTASKMVLREGVSAAVISNDQGSQLVDTAFFSSLNIPNEEIKSGCFCCHYEKFSSAVQHLISSMHPDIIFAEAVGSCADLVATIIKPMLHIEPGIKITLSVFADGQLLFSLLEGRSSFVSDDVRYVYKKQLEEAGILVVNKSDNLTQVEIDRVRSHLESEYPGKKLLFQDSRDETSVKAWLDLINVIGDRKLRSLDMNYDTYARGEAALAWLDASIMLHSKETAISRSYELMDNMYHAISSQRLAIGHLKFFLRSGDWKQKISYTTLEKRNTQTLTTNKLADHATLLVNARVETDPDKLKKIFFETLNKTRELGCHIEMLDFASFRPGFPRPTYRLAE